MLAACVQIRSDSTELWSEACRLIGVHSCRFPPEPPTPSSLAKETALPQDPPIGYITCCTRAIYGFYKTSNYFTRLIYS